MRHPESGAEAIATEYRDQRQNRRLAFQRMVKNPRFDSWRRAKAKDIIRGKDLDKMVEESMRPENIRTETYNEKTKCWEQLD